MKTKQPTQLVATVLATLALLLATGFPKEDKVSDQELSDAVEAKLIWDSSVFANDIDVDVKAGVVNLSGQVNDLGEKRRAARIAKSRKGVRSVINQIEVRATDLSDAEIKEFADAALNADPVTSEFDVATETDDGLLILRGEVPGFAAKQLVERVAAGVIGVRDVDNRLDITWAEQRPDKKIASQVRQELERDLWVESDLIEVSVEDQVVHLSGAVGSAAEKDRAVAQAWVAGVDDVDDAELEVEPWMDEMTQRERQNPPLSDEKIANAIRDSFIFDPRVFSFSPDVTVRAGGVTLRGTVDNILAKRAAERDARNTVGVNYVINLLKVRTPESRSEEDIENSIIAALARDPDTESYEISVDVDNGRAILTGSVDSNFEKAEAEKTAAGIVGVKEVRNRITVWDLDSDFLAYPDDAYGSYAPYQFTGISRERPSLDDRQVRNDVEDELFWSWQVDSDDVDVAVEDGTVTLTGTVETRRARRAAEDLAYDAGAFVVENRLRIEGESKSTASAN